LHFVLLNGGARILTVVTGSPTTPPFTASIVSTGNRLTLPRPGVIVQLKKRPVAPGSFVEKAFAPVFWGHS
jgi:hypothetical protein